ncbi:MAG: hypothetical protein LBP58_10240 [Azoarcus sp.]|jgi:citrate synthase|nr:hypothetical protein [Azoarcus sp.]
MVKAIKFNLIIDGQPIRNLDDLRENFNVEDVLATYRNGSLKRWLETRELKEEVAALEKVPDDVIGAAKELCRILCGDCTEQELEAAAYVFRFRQEEAKELQQYKNFKEKKEDILGVYHNGYAKLLEEMEEKDKDYSFLKPAVCKLLAMYPRLYRLDAEVFYKRFIKDHPLVILAMLANRDARELIAREPEQIYEDLNSDGLLSNFSQWWTEFLKIRKPLPRQIKSFSGETEGYWKDLEPKGKDFLIIKMEKDNFVRNAGKGGEELGADKVNGKFPILNGIDYKSNNKEHQLVYMEV